MTEQQPPATAILSGIVHIEDTLDTLVKPQGKLDSAIVMVADLTEVVKDTLLLVKDATEAMTERLDSLHQLRPAAPPQSWTRWLWRASYGLLLGAALWGWWWYLDARRYRALALGVDSVLERQVNALPKGIQEQLHVIYDQTHTLRLDRRTKVGGK